MRRRDLLAAAERLALVLEQRLEGRLFPELRRRLSAALPASRRNAILPDDGAVVIKVDLRGPRRELAEQLCALRRASALVVTDPDIMGGDLVLRGTRVPVHLIATLVDRVSTEADILKAYPRLTTEMIRLAPVCAQAYPLRGRPRKQP